MKWSELKEIMGMKSSCGSKSDVEIERHFEENKSTDIRLRSPKRQKQYLRYLKQWIKEDK